MNKSHYPPNLNLRNRASIRKLVLPFIAITILCTSLLTLSNVLRLYSFQIQAESIDTQGASSTEEQGTSSYVNGNAKTNEEEILHKKLAREGVLKVGMEANYSPFNWTQTSPADGAYPISNSPGEYANGYDLQMAKLLADSMGLKLEIQKIEWDGLTPALMSGLIDCIIAGMSPTAERREQIDFSNSYYTSDLVLVIKGDSKFSEADTLSDFSGAKITAQLNTFHYQVIDQINGVNKQAALDSFPTMISALRANSIDAYVSERPGAMAAVASNPDLRFISFEANKGFVVNDEDVSISVGVRKDSGLDKDINIALASISEDKRQNIMSEMIRLETVDADSNISFVSSMKDIINNYAGLFLRGAAITMLISISGTLAGFFIGLIVQILREIPIRKRSSLIYKFSIKLLHLLLNIYIEIFRGTPMMVQAILIFYGSRLFFNLEMSPMIAGFIIVSINTGAYLAEVIRGGIRSVDKAQHEACQALGLSHTQSMRYVILPQTIKAILPSVGNEFVVNIKDTSVLNVISVTELFFATKSIAGSTFLIFQTYIITALIYFVLTFTTTRLINYFGTRHGNKKPFSLSSSTGGLKND